MRILVIGGNGFIGSHVVRELKAAGHDVAVFHRGNRPFSGAKEIIGDRNHLPGHAEEIGAFAPNVVVDMVLSSARQAQQLVQLFREKTERIVAISSMDVYRAAGLLHGTEPGPLQELPLTEESAVREKVSVYPPETVKMLKTVFTWLDDEYDKVLVERALRSHSGLAVTVLRLPMVYGPGDPLHRLFPLLKRMRDDRPALLFEEGLAGWRGPRGYVEDVAHAIGLATADPRAAANTYNVASERILSELDWAKAVGASYGWRGDYVVLPHDRVPLHLVQPGNVKQHWVASSQKIRNELGFREMVSFEEGLKRTIDWELANPPAHVDPEQFDYAAEDRALNAAA